MSWSWYISRGGKNSRRCQASPEQSGKNHRIAGLVGDSTTGRRPSDAMRRWQPSIGFASICVLASRKVATKLSVKEPPRRLPVLQNQVRNNLRNQGFNACAVQMRLSQLPADVRLRWRCGLAINPLCCEPKSPREIGSPSRPVRRSTLARRRTPTARRRPKRFVAGAVDPGDFQWIVARSQAGGVDQFDRPTIEGRRKLTASRVVPGVS